VISNLIIIKATNDHIYEVGAAALPPRVYRSIGARFWPVCFCKLYELCFQRSRCVSATFIGRNADQEHGIPLSGVPWHTAASTTHSTIAAFTKPTAQRIHRCADVKALDVIIEETADATFGVRGKPVVDWEVHSSCFLNQTGRQNVTIKLRLLLLRLQVSLQLCAHGPSFPGAAAAATSAVSTLAAPTAAATSAFPGAATAAATAVQEQFDPGIRIGRRHGFRGGDNHKQGSLKSIGLKTSRGAGPKSLLRKGRIEE
jgi:hypothetical protein